MSSCTLYTELFGVELKLYAEFDYTPGKLSTYWEPGYEPELNVTTLEIRALAAIKEQPLEKPIPLPEALITLLHDTISEYIFEEMERHGEPEIYDVRS